MTNLDYLYNPEIVKPALEKNYFIDKKLGFEVIEHGTIFPHKKLPYAENSTLKFWGVGGIVDSNGKFIKHTHAINFINDTPPLQNQFNIALKQSFISVCSFTFGDMQLPITFAAFGFWKANLSSKNLKIVRLSIVHGETIHLRNNKILGDY